MGRIKRWRCRGCGMECTPILLWGKSLACPACLQLLPSNKQPKGPAQRRKTRVGTRNTPKTPVREIWERDRGICHLCLRYVDIKLPIDGKHPMRATRDHVIPKSRGGTNEKHNLRLAHYICNHRRQDRDMVIESSA